MLQYFYTALCWEMVVMHMGGLKTWKFTNEVIPTWQFANMTLLCEWNEIVGSGLL